LQVRQQLLYSFLCMPQVFSFAVAALFSFSFFRLSRQCASTGHDISEPNISSAEIALEI